MVNNQKVKLYIEKEFKTIPKSQHLFDLKQELVMNMQDRMKDYQNNGMTEEEAFVEAKVSLGDLSNLKQDMIAHGENPQKQQLYSSMTNRVSSVGMVIGVSLVLFGVLMMVSMSYMEVPLVAIPGTGIFAVFGGALLTYSLLARETVRKFAMNKIRAILYSISIGVFLFAIYVGFTSSLATNEIFIGITSATVFIVISVALGLSLLLTERNDRKK